jgi:serine/threonine-protein kinase PknK
MSDAEGQDVPVQQFDQLGLDGYEDVSEVARGGFGVVYKAFQTSVARTAAIKVLNATPDARTAARFEQECKALGLLSGHPNIVTVFDAGVTPSGRAFLSMEYLPNGSLADRLSNDGPFRWEEVLEIGIKISGALATAHNAKLLHRDIKPENVLLSDYEEPLLADFGLARLQSGDMVKSTTILATPAHAAPEVIGGQPASAASDIYSLGSSLFALLYGHPAFVEPTDENVLSVMARLATAPPPDLRPLGVPDLVCRVLEWSMHKQPEQRPSSAQGFGESLQRVQSQLGVERTQLPIGGSRQRGAGTGPRQVTPTPGSPLPGQTPQPPMPAPAPGTITVPPGPLTPTGHTVPAYATSGGAPAPAAPLPSMAVAGGSGAAAAPSGSLSGAFYAVSALAIVILFVVGLLVGAALGG